MHAFYIRDTESHLTYQSQFLWYNMREVYYLLTQQSNLCFLCRWSMFPVYIYGIWARLLLSSGPAILQHLGDLCIQAEWERDGDGGQRTCPSVDKNLVAKMTITALTKMGVSLSCLGAGKWSVFLLGAGTCPLVSTTGYLGSQFLIDSHLAS